MADMSEQQTGVIEQPAPHASASGSPNLVQVNAPMMGLTWLTFGILAFVLYKIAWKPILTTLDQREKQIRIALEEAEKSRAEYAEIERHRQQLIDEADTKAREIVEQARKAAVETANKVQEKARDEAGILLANAQRDIQIAHANALSDLRRESVELAIGLSRKILADQIDEPRARELVNKGLQKA